MTDSILSAYLQGRNIGLYLCGFFVSAAGDFRGEVTMKNLDDVISALAKQAMSQEAFLSARQLAKHLGMQPDTIHKKYQRGQIPGHKLGYSRRFKLSEVLAALSK